MNDATLLNLLGHLANEWAVVAITPDEVAVLRGAGYVESRSLRLTEAGHAKLAGLRGVS